MKNHLSQIIKDEEIKDITLVVNKKYAMNELHKSRDIYKLLEAVHKIYWQDYSLTIKLELADMSAHENDEDVFVPHTVRY